MFEQLDSPGINKRNLIGVLLALLVILIVVMFFVGWQKMDSAKTNTKIYFIFLYSV